MRMKVYQRGVVREIIIRGVDTKVGIGNGGTRHMDRVDDLLKVGRRTVRLDVVNGEDVDEGRKAKRTAYLTKRINQSHD